MKLPHNFFPARNSTAAVRRQSSQSAFTMVEIALCLAIIGFALVAIIGSLPAGLNVQKENREDTIINQDASYLMDAIRGGARGLNELTNNVLSITNSWTLWDASNPQNWKWLGSNVDGYTRTGSLLTSTGPTIIDNFPLTNGFNIICLLSKPKLESLGGAIIRSNHVVALVRAITGAASEKFPQTNTSVLDLGLNYRMVAEVHNLQTDDLGSAYTQKLRANLHEVRLKFSWPLFPGNRFGNGRQTFRTLVGGQLMGQRAPLQINGQPVFYFNSSAYEQVSP